MRAPTGPGRARVKTRRRPAAGPRGHDVLVHRAALLATIAGLVTVLALAVLAALADIGTTATVAISAVAAMVTAAMGVSATYLRRRK